MHDLGNVLLRHIDRELCPLEGLELDVDARDIGDLARTCAGVDTLAVVLLAVREGRRDVDREEVRTRARLRKDRALDGVARCLRVDSGGKDDGGTRTGELRSDEREALEVLGALLRGRREGCG